jgi:hypothetical protein
MDVTQTTQVTQVPPPGSYLEYLRDNDLLAGDSVIPDDKAHEAVPSSVYHQACALIRITRNIPTYDALVAEAIKYAKNGHRVSDLFYEPAMALSVKEYRKLTAILAELDKHHKDTRRKRWSK